MVKESQKNIKNEKKRNRQKSVQFDRPNTRWVVLDAVIFLILLLILSLSMLMISASPKDADHYYTHYDESDEYLEHSIQALLSSTTDSASYMDTMGNEIELGSQSMEHLILIDLNMRNSDSEEFNTTSLELGLEHDLLGALNSIIGVGQDFVFICQYTNSDNELIKTGSNIFLTNQETTMKLDKEKDPRFEKHLSLPSNPIDDLKGDEVVIRLYLV